jgi:cytoskeletal protein RodZ
MNIEGLLMANQDQRDTADEFFAALNAVDEGSSNANTELSDEVADNLTEVEPKKTDISDVKPEQLDNVVENQPKSEISDTKPEQSDNVVEKQPKREISGAKSGQSDDVIENLSEREVGNSTAESVNHSEDDGSIPEASVEDDEPLFKQPEKPKAEKEKKSFFIPMVLFLLMLVLLVVLVFNMGSDDSDLSPDTQPVNSSEQMESSVYLDGADPYNSISNGVPLPNVYTDSTVPEQEITQSQVSDQAQAAEIQDGLNALLVTKLDEIIVMQNSLAERVIELSTATSSLSSKVDNNQTALQSEIKSLKKITQSLGLDGRNRDTAISELLTAVKGFEIDIQNQRNAFPLELLHSEVWSGKQRVVAFKPSSPRNILKIYEGEQFEGWLLVSIKNEIAIFKNIELNETVEIAL